MAVNFSDSFDSYSATADLMKKWASANVVAPIPILSSSSGRFATNCVQIPTGSGQQTALNSRTGVLSSATKQASGFWFKCSAGATATNNSPILVYSTSAGAFVSGIGVTTTGPVGVFSNATTAILTGAINLLDGNYHWIESILQNGTTVNQKVYVDGTLEINTNGTLTGTLDRFALWSVKGTGNTFVDDLIIFDDVSGGLTTASVPLGPRRAGVMRPASDSVTSWTTSTGTAHWSLIDEVAGDRTDYVTTSTAAQSELYGYTALGYSPTSISTVVVNNYFENPNAGSFTVKSQCKSNTTTTQGASTTVPVGPFTYQTEFINDPNTTAAWASVTPLNSALFGISS